MRPLRALAYSAGLCVAFSLPSIFFATSRTFDLVAIALVLGAFGLLVWIVLMRPVFGAPLAALRTAQVLRIVIIARLLGALVPCGCVDLLTGAFVVEAVNRADFYVGVVPTDFVATAIITLGQGAILLIEFVLMAAASYWVVRRSALEHNPDICISCGYDIRASREIGRCPECGTRCPPLRFTRPGPAVSGGPPG